MNNLPVLGRPRLASGVFQQRSTPGLGHAGRGVRWTRSYVDGQFELAGRDRIRAPVPRARRAARPARPAVRLRRAATTRTPGRRSRSTRSSAEVRGCEPPCCSPCLAFAVLAVAAAAEAIRPRRRPNAASPARPTAAAAARSAPAAVDYAARRDAPAARRRRRRRGRPAAPRRDRARTRSTSTASRTLERLRWAGWGTPRATARGTVRTLVCDPTCAQRAHRALRGDRRALRHPRLRLAALLLGQLRLDSTRSRTPRLPEDAVLPPCHLRGGRLTARRRLAPCGAGAGRAGRGGRRTGTASGRSARCTSGTPTARRRSSGRGPARPRRPGRRRPRPASGCPTTWARAASARPCATSQAAERAVDGRGDPAHVAGARRDDERGWAARSAAAGRRRLAALDRVHGGFGPGRDAERAAGHERRDVLADARRGVR